MAIIRQIIRGSVFKTMRIVIDARLYGIEHRGLGRYTECLLNELIQQNTKDEFIFLIDPRSKSRLAELPVNCRLIPMPVRVYSLAEQFFMPLVLWLVKPDLVHFTHFNAPYFVPAKYILTVHDLIINHFPDSRASRLPSWLYKIKLFFYYQLIKHNIKQAEKIITVSNFVADDIVKHYQISAEKIIVTYLSSNLPSSSTCGDMPLSKYFLYVGSAYPHKNLDYLISGFLQFTTTHPDYQLVIVGKLDAFMLVTKAKHLKEFNNKKIIFWGEATDEELTCLYQKTEAYITATLMEGFGLGPLEAARFGKISLVSDIPVFREIYQNNLIYFKTNEVANLTQSLLDFIKTPSLDIQNKVKSLNNLLSGVSWSKASEIILETYKKIYVRTKN